MTDVAVRFLGGPLDGATASVRATRAGRPPDLFTVDADVLGGGTGGIHDYRVATAPHGAPWQYEYIGIRRG
ncbi:MAG TPA: hypothetical protein VJT31_37765 [Rugosimonospora sp.]|nr:hypothetical protein [Rugosimonospora sp.]